MQLGKTADKPDVCPECGSSDLRHHDCGECTMDWCHSCGVHLSLAGRIWHSLPDVVESPEER